MKITIATGIYPPDIGGIAEYSRELANSFLISGHEVRVVTYGILKKIPTGIRHILYFLKLVFTSLGTDYIIGLDTYSTGFPAIVFSILFRKKIIIRVGGDFLWESYVNRTHDMIMLSKFYGSYPKLSVKEKIIFYLTKFVLHNSNAVVFNTEWQRDLWLNPYGLNVSKIFVIENVYLPHEHIEFSHEKTFFSPTRDSYVKNKRNTKNAFELAKSLHGEIILDTDIVSHEVMIEKISKCYAVLAVSLSDVSPNLVSYALQYGKPVIMTEDTGMKKRLQNKVIFVNPLNTEEISRAITNLLNLEIYEKYRNEILNDPHTHSWNEIAEEFLEIYKKI